MKTNIIRFIDLFAGIGGFRNGLESVGNKGGPHNEEKPKATDGNKRRTNVCLKKCNPTFSCVYSNEWNKYARQIYKKHYGDCDERDIKTVPAKEIPDHELLCAGWPCQSFSIAGKRKGFGDTRGTLFWEICRILRDKRPDYLLLENVKGLLSHQNGWTFATIILSLDDLGYDVQWQVLNSKNFGVPQNRERVFIIGHLRGEGRPEIFPLVQSTQGNLAYSAGVISAREKWLKKGKNYSREFSQGQRIYSTKGISQTLAGNAGGLGAKTGLYQLGEKGVARCLDANYQKGRTNHPQRTMIINRPHGFNKGLIKQYPNLRAESSSEQNEILINRKQIRRLTPVECERLQGFPDNWTEGISDTQRYKCLGNAVTTNVITAVGNKFIKSLEAEKTLWD